MDGDDNGNEYAPAAGIAPLKTGYADVRGYILFLSFFPHVCADEAYAAMPERTLRCHAPILYDERTLLCFLARRLTHRGGPPHR